MYSVTFRHVRSTIVDVENQYYILGACVCSLWYPACNAHAPYCVLWPAPLYDVSDVSTLSHKRHDWGDVTEHKMWVFISSTTFV